MKKYENVNRFLTKCAALAAIIGGCLLLAQCRGAEKAAVREGVHLDTLVRIQVYAGDSRGEEILDACFAEVRRYEALFSRTAAGGDIGRLNAAAGRPVTVSEETAALLETALAYGRLTDGAFDVTIAPASALWDFKAESPRLPDAGALAEAAGHVDYTGLHVDGRTAWLDDPEAAVDLGGIAKGYIADRLADYLKSRDITGALIDLGGNIVAVGGKPDGAWKIGISRPDREEAGLAASVAVRDLSVVTSGDYQRGFELDGAYYHHILDPATGYPADAGLRSVTVAGSCSADADALATACFVLGPEKGMALIEGTPETEALFIDRSGALTGSTGWAALAAD